MPRGDLAKILYDRTSTTCAYVFGDSITSLTETVDGIDVTFARAAPRRFDPVVGADGMHSNVRRLAFGPESDYVTYLGYYYAQVGLASREDQMYNEPGRMVAVSGGQDPAFFVFTSPPLSHDRDDVDQQKKLLIEAYRGGGWKIPELLAQVPDTTYFWMDSISRVTADRHASGRVALLGDAAYGNALAVSARGSPSSAPTCWPASSSGLRTTTAWPTPSTRPSSAGTPASRRRSTPGV